MDQINNFRNFLKKYGAYEKFCANLLAQRNSSFEKTMHRHSNLSGVINKNLTWSSTLEGQDYWSNLNKLWNTGCKLDVEFIPGYKSIW